MAPGANEADADMAALLQTALREHGAYIMANLEYPAQSHHPNHYIANLAGLLMSATALKDEAPEAAAWRAFALPALADEILNQTGADGVQFELATAYHALVLEMCMVPLVFAARTAGGDSPRKIADFIRARAGPKAADRLRTMFGVLAAFTQPDGLIPLLGDNDSGRFLPLEGAGLDPRDWRFLSYLGAALYEDPGLCPHAVDDRHAAYTRALLGSAPANVAFEAAYVGGALCTATVARPAPISVAFEAAGQYVMKTADACLFIQCGPVGTNGRGGHAHNDKLSVTLELQGLELIVDPGVYVYTASEYFRNLYRSTAGHNTLTLDGEEQNRYGADSRWWGMRDDTQCRCLEWRTSLAEDYFTGQHSGYQRLARGAIHRRSIRWLKRERRIELADTLLETRPDNGVPAARATFNLHPDCVIAGWDGRTIHFERAAVRAILSAAQGAWSTRPYYYSTAYGVKQYAQQLVLTWDPESLSNRLTLDY